MKKRKFDFSGIEAYVKCEEGQHLVKLVEIEENESSNGNDMLSATFQVVKGSSTGAKLYDNFVLTEKALWKLQSFLIAIGVKAEGKIVIDLDKLVGKTCIVEVAHEEYDGKTRARIQEFKKVSVKGFEEDEDEEDDEESEEEQPKKKANKKPTKPVKKSSEDEDEEDDDEWDDEWDED